MHGKERPQAAAMHPPDKKSLERERKKEGSKRDRDVSGR